MEEKYIPVNEAIAANDRVFGIMFCLFVAFAAAVLLAVILYEKRRNRKAAQEIEERVEEAENRIRAEYEKKRRSTWTFRMWQDTRRELETVQKELSEKTSENVELKKELDNLKKDAAACPAFGTVSRRGAAV